MRRVCITTVWADSKRNVKAKRRRLFDKLNRGTKLLSVKFARSYRDVRRVWVIFLRPGERDIWITGLTFEQLYKLPDGVYELPD